MWFIDGASYIDTDDDQWDYYVTFEKFKNSENYDQWAVAGFSTVFQFYAYPDMIRPRVRFIKNV
jgi:histone acetyltransferase 1